MRNKSRTAATTAALSLAMALTGTAFAGDPSQWGAQKVNEYEGQHRAHGGPEYGAAKASPKLLLAGQDPEFPATPH